MSKLQSSDFNPTMVASRTFSSILQQIQSSNLNYQLQISPFSATISLKKTPIKDKYGAPLLPPPQCPPQPAPKPLCPSTRSTAATCCASDADLAALAAKNLQLEKDLVTLRRDYDNSVSDCVAAHHRIKSLENLCIEKTKHHEVLKSEIYENNALVTTLNLEINQLNLENYEFRTSVENQTHEIKDLESLIKAGKQASNKLNKEISEMRANFNKEKETIAKEHRMEVKAWKKELGDERKQRIALERNKVKEGEHPKAMIEKAEDSNMNIIVSESSETSSKSSKSSTTQLETIDCSICAKPIPDYEPELFLGVEMLIEMNPACESCKAVDTEVVTLAKDDLETRQVQFEDPYSLDSTSEDSNCINSTTSLNMIGLDTTCLSTTSMNTLTMDSTQVQPSRKSLFPLWTCKVCHTDIPWGQTWQQTLHEKKHRDEPKD